MRPFGTEKKEVLGFEQEREEKNRTDDIRCRKKKYVCKASLTVEASLIMPLILACIFLLIFLNFYLHDMIVLNASGEELLYAEEDTDLLIQQEAEKNMIVLQHVTLEKKENPVTKQVVWNKTYKIPLQRFLSTIGGKTEAALEGHMTSKSYSLSKAVRLMKERN